MNRLSPAGRRAILPALKSAVVAPIIGIRPFGRAAVARAEPMHLPTPDPSYTASAPARARFRLAAALSLGFVALVWALQTVNWALGLDAAPFGVRPRTIEGLSGIVFAPLSHGGFEHLIANTIPLAVLGTAMLHLYPRSSRVVLPWVWLGSGAAVWMFGRDAIHVGASGLIYGLTAYIFVAGLIRRDRRAIAASLAVAFLYGSAVWGVMPIRRADSWETHLAAAIIGVVLAVLLRRRDVPPKIVYSWEQEGDADLSTDATAPR